MHLEIAKSQFYSVYACVCVFCFPYLFVLLSFLTRCLFHFISHSLFATLYVQFMLCDELLSISVPFKVIVCISTTIHISKHYTVQTFNLDSHKPFRGEREKDEHFKAVEHRKECDAMRTHTHKRIPFILRNRRNSTNSSQSMWTRTHYMCLSRYRRQSPNKNAN